MRIAVLAPSHPNDKRALSTCLYYMTRALEKHCDVYYRDPTTSLEKRFGRLLDALSRRTFKKAIAYDRLLLAAKKHGKIATKRLIGQSFDAIVAIMNPIDIAFIDTDVPIALVSDATFALQHDYQAQVSNLWPWSTHQAQIVEQLAYHNAAALLFSSDWAARSAIDHYHIDPQKVHNISFGANLDHIPPQAMVLAKRQSDHCRLLFMAVGWQRKGGPIAFETLLKLEEMGIRAELIVCGTTPPRDFAHERMVVIPYLDKNDARQNRAIENLYATSDFLLVPTRAEAYGHVFCEASAFGLPSITTTTGGVPEVVRDGENGYTLPYGATGTDYARVIAEIYQDKQRYAALVASSRAAFESRMNWDVWGRNVMQILQAITDRHP